jgi:hypothetical protein
MKLLIHDSSDLIHLRLPVAGPASLVRADRQG